MTVETSARARDGKSQIKNVEIKITTTGDPKSPYDIKWEKSLLGISYWGDPPIGTKKDCNVCLNFKLDDKAGTGVEFQTPATSAFGANPAAAGCPAAGSDASGEIDFQDSTASPKELSILDVNQNAGDLQFAIFFNNGPMLDPIIKNTGGGTPPSGIMR